MVPTTAQRQPRFRRKIRLGLRATERDLDILQFVGQHRFLATHHVVDLLGAARDATGRSQPIERRLNRLYHHGLLDRPKAQLTRYVTGSKPIVYCLTPKGARLVLEHRGSSHAAGSTQRHYLDHGLQVSDIRVSAAVSCRRHDTHLISFEEILEEHAPDKTRRRAGKERVDGWSLTFTHDDRKKYTLPVYPDTIFALPDEPAPAIFFVEADRGTEPLTRSDLKHRSSIFKKLVLYYETWKLWRDKERTPHPPYGFRNPRVLFVVSDNNAGRRIARIQALGQQHGMASGLFLFAEHEELLKGDFLTHEWGNLQGKPVTLLAQ